MLVLVINAGSSSLKYQLIDMETEAVVAKGNCERIGINGGILTHRANGAQHVQKTEMPDHTAAIKLVLDALVSKEHGVISRMEEIGAVGHRLVHGAEDYSGSVLINDEVLACCRKNQELAPLHNPANIMGITACREVLPPSTPMVAVFDTAFHTTMPEKAYLYALAYSDYKKYRVRKYGFHGTSHMFVSGEAAKFLNRDIASLKTVTCHLGNGSSVAAVRGGQSVETSMGFTPLEGLPMGTRSGSIDPAIIEYLMDKTGQNIHQVTAHLNKECGMLGLSENSSDFRDLTENGALDIEGNRRAVDLFAYRVKKYIGEYSAVMNGLDVVVFTAGVGENTAYVREKACEDMSYLGLELDKELNKNCPRGQIVDIALPSSAVRILVIPTNEELVIARETLAICAKKK